MGNAHNKKAGSPLFGVFRRFFGEKSEKGGKSAPRCGQNHPRKKLKGEKKEKKM
jgi:hypothetical protein